MANRKQELDAAVSQSRQEVAEREAAMQQPQSAPSKPEFKLPYTKAQEAAAKAPMHPRAAQTRETRQAALAKGMKAGRQKEQELAEAGKAKVAAGEGIVGHKTKKVHGPKDVSKKFNPRQVKRGKRQVIQSGDVTVSKDYEEYGTTNRVRAVTTNELKERKQDAAQQAQLKAAKKPKRNVVGKTEPLSAARRLPSGRRTK